MYRAIVILAIGLVVLAFVDALTGGRGARRIERVAKIRWGRFLYHCGLGFAVLWLAFIVWLVYPRVLAPVIIHAPLPAATCTGPTLDRDCRLAILKAVRNGSLAPDKFVAPTFGLILRRAEYPAIVGFLPLGLMLLIGAIRALRVPKSDRLALR
ncbi:MAG TPA: hypothetical protein VJR47_15780 [Stellaceae bacterium]|nr:hypothetical protein [Stellaceae bacterium]